VTKAFRAQLPELLGAELGERVSICTLPRSRTTSSAL